MAHDFDESLLSGYVDGELTQAESQRVRIHVEDCAECRAIAEHIRTTREATMTTEFKVPPDEQWDERPRGPLSSALRNFGWLIAALWVALTVGFVVWQIATETENPLEAAIGFGFWLAVLLLFGSVLIDRIRSARTDRYRKVQK